MKKLTYIFLLLCLPILSIGQGAAVEFGKNRVQYHDFEWWQYESENFTTYWYKGGQNIGQSAVQIAEFDYNEIRTMLEYRINDKIELLVYTDLTDLKQSNVGNDEIFLNSNGSTKIVGNKVFIYFDGNHVNLRRQIRQGTAQVLLNNMMFGVNLQEIVQNAVLMNLPTWFTNGLVNYIGDDIPGQNGWSTDLDNRLRDLIQSEEVTSFEDLVAIDPTFAGHSFWYFIGENYGKSTVSNLLYLTRINRSVESGFLYVLGGSYNETTANWRRFFDNKYKVNDSRATFEETNQVDYKNKKNIPVTQLKISPDGKRIAYVQNEIGKYTVFIQDIESGKRTIVKKEGNKNIFQSTDYNYPLLSWTADNQSLAVVFEKRDELKLMMYGVQNKKSEVSDFPPRYERILSFDFYDSRQVVFSALEKGYSNIYTYDIKTRGAKQITKDFYDDLDPVFVKIDGRKGIVFSSNRPDSLLIAQKLDTILPITNFDIWYYDLETKGLKELVQITNTPLANEFRPIAIDERYFGFLSDQSGITNRYIGYIDTVFAYDERVYLLKGAEEEIILHADSILNIAAENIDTTFIRSIFKPKGFTYANSDYNRSLLDQHTAPRVGKVVQLVQKDNAYSFYLEDLMAATKVSTTPTQFILRKEKLYQESLKKEVEIERVEEEIKEKLNPKTENPFFQSEFENQEKEKTDTVPIVKVESTPKPAKDTGKIDIDNYFFQSEFEDVEAEKPTEVVVDTDGGETVVKPKVAVVQKKKEIPSVHKFRRSRITPYQLKFSSNFVSTTLDNSLLFDGRIPFAGENQFYDFPTPGILFMGNIDDLFEDYRIQAGVRIPTTFNGAEYFLVASDLSKRLDKRYSFYRRSIRETEIYAHPTIPNAFYEANVRTISNLLEAQFKYPLDIFTSIRGTATFRTDTRNFLADNLLTLEQDPLQEQRIGAKAEYVFDNTLDVKMNIKNGTRYKVYSEIQKSFSVRLDNEEGLVTDFQDGWLGVVGLDARHYQPLDKHSILAVRLSGATSFGDEKILYYLGGTDNWLFPRFEGDIPVDPTVGYAYQALATNLRGFNSNIRNGNSFVTANFELRVPVFNYFTRRPIKSSFVRNFQVVGFFDTGTAWVGLSPFNEENPLNTVIIDEGVYTIKVNYFRNPIVSGYGVGLRTTVFGYFLRLDFARGIETGIVQDRRIHLSLGTDF
ncbi:MAG: hypothetical protein AB8G11_10385 [Saprospiraceae bacterium]